MLGILRCIIHMPADVTNEMYLEDVREIERFFEDRPQGRTRSAVPASLCQVYY